MAGPILKETIKKPIKEVVDITKPIVSNILTKASEIVTKSEGKPKKIDESKIVKDKSEVVIDQAEGSAQAEAEHRARVRQDPEGRTVTGERIAPRGHGAPSGVRAGPRAALQDSRARRQHRHRTRVRRSNRDCSVQARDVRAGGVHHAVPRASARSALHRRGEVPAGGPDVGRK